MKKLYYLVAVNHTNMTSQNKTYLASAVGYNKVSMEKLCRDRQKEHPNYLFWVGDQWKTKEGMEEILKLPKLFE